MLLVNLTPHPVAILGAVVVLVPPEPVPARCLDHGKRVRTEVVVSPSDPHTMTSLEVVRNTQGATEGLPEPSPNVGYLVSVEVAQANPGRKDLYVPARPVRDRKGLLIGYRALATFAEDDGW